jgi:pimeloyl-ACP methyl ester carboxylesterase
VAAADGTDLAVLSLGHGPGLVVVHGSMQSAVSQLDLAVLLAGGHTVHLMERRGRGRSGPYPVDASTDTEVGDLAAVLAATGARAALGISSGALIVGRAAMSAPALDRAVLFEPPLVVDGSIALEFVERFEHELGEDDLAGAMVTAMLGAQMGPPFLRLAPRFLLKLMSRRQLTTDAAVPPEPGRVRLVDLVHALHQDFRIVTEQAGRLEEFRAVGRGRTRVLLLAGTKTRPYLQRAVDALGTEIPDAQLVLLPGTNHGATQNRDQWGKPDAVAAAVLPFLSA